MPLSSFISNFSHKNRESKTESETESYTSKTKEKVLVIVGTGVMGTTAGVLINELSKSIGESIKIIILESESGPGMECSNVLHNAGTGHEANCELNFTPGDKHNVNIRKALDIHAQYNISKQFWSYLSKQNIIQSIGDIINKVKHVSVVQEDNIGFLKKRFEKLKDHHFFDRMVFSEDLKEISKWIPLVTDNWKKNTPIAATMVPSGTDVNYGKLTEEMAEYLESQDNIEIHYNTYVEGIKKVNGEWKVKTINKDKKRKKYRADTVLSAAGGGAIGLLKKSGIPQAKKYASFPIGGGFLMASDVNIPEYNTKAYGKASKGSPPMSVPHLDIRYIDGKTHILFGPFALFNLKVKKNGNLKQYLETIRPHDIPSMLKSSARNLNLMKYLIKESIKAKSKKLMIEELEEFAPGLGDREGFDWKFIQAGQRVQIIENGELHFGTRMVYSSDKRYASLLGASPGASVSPDIIKEWAENTFPELIKAPMFKEIFPEPDKEVLKSDPKRYYQIREKVNNTLGIQINGNSEEK